MFKKKFAALAIAVAASYSSGAFATQAIQFDADGSGSATPVSVGTFDWAPGSALAIGGNPQTTGVVVGTKVTLLAQTRLTQLLDPNGNPILFGLSSLPPNTEITFVTAFPEVAVVAGSTGYTFFFDQNPPAGALNYFEIWVSTPDSNSLNGTGFQNTKRIFYGQVTDSSGGFGAPTGTGTFDQSPDGDQWGGQQTIIGSGSTQIKVNAITVDADYFPGFTPDVLDTIVAKFNTSTVVPFAQANPSKQFVDQDAGADASSPDTTPKIPDLGPVNGQPDPLATHDFELQADANQSFEVGTVVTGACRVTYGGNDKNGNIDLTKFGSACSSNPDKSVNCYTFGGQVGAPTANPSLGGPYGEHTHHNVSGPAGDFVFHAGTHSSLKSTRITATACKDPGACRQAVANASFKQIDFEGTGSFRTLNSVATAYLSGKAGHPVAPDSQDKTNIYYFRVDMDDTGEPGDKPSKKGADVKACASFLDADQNKPLSTADPLLNDFASCNACADVYQFYICKDSNPCEQSAAIYAVRGFLTGGNIQLHRIIK